jgi:hypothetical protein
MLLFRRSTGRNTAKKGDVASVSPQLRKRPCSAANWRRLPQGDIVHPFRMLEIVVLLMCAGRRGYTEMLLLGPADA